MMNVKLECERVGDNASILSNVKSELTDEHDDAVDRLIKCEEKDEHIKHEVNDENNIALVRDEIVAESHGVVKTRKYHMCPVCNKIFDKPSRLKTHIVIHTGERKYHCDVCNKSFTQASSLKRHIKIIHLSQKNFHL